MHIEANHIASRGKRIVASLTMLTLFAILSAAGILLTRGESNFSALWISNGFLVAALWQYRVRISTIHILACAAIGFAIAFSAGDSWPKALAISLANAVEVGLAIFLLRRTCGANINFANIRNLTWFAVVGGLVAPMASGGLVAALLSPTVEYVYLIGWLDWVVAHSLGMLIFAPICLILSGEIQNFDGWHKKLDIEYFVIIGVGALLTIFVFSQTSYPFLFMTSLFALIAATRKGIAGASIAVAVIAIIAIEGTFSGTGPVHLVQGDVHDKIFVVQIFLLFTFASSLPFASILEAQKVLQRELRIRHDQTQSIFDNMRDVVFRTDKLGRWTLLNPAWETITGYSIDQALGWSVTKLLTKKSFQDSEVEYLRLISGEVNTLTLNQTFLRADGKERHVEVFLEAVRDEKSQFAGATGNIRDVTEAKSSRHALEKSEERFRRLAESAPVGFFQADAAGRIFYVSKAWRDRVGLREDAVEGNAWLPTLKDTDSHNAGEAFSGLEKPGDRREQVSCHSSADGEEIWVRTVIQAEFDIEMNIVGYVGVIVDITEQHQAIEELRQREKDLREARDSAEAATAAKASFLANMSHEIRTPMNGVLGFAEMLRQSDLDDHQEKYVELIEESGKIMMALLNDILDLSKIDAGLLKLSPEPFELAHFLKGMRDMMQTAAGNQNLALNLEYADDLPKFVAHDKLRLRQILTNLIGNAIKFTEAGSITIRAEVPDQDQSRFKISIIDTGIGIPEQRQRSIFDEFVQAEDDTDRSFGGTGLGLAISRKLVAMMGGTISLQSAVGAGSTFSIDIPSSACIDPRDETVLPVDSTDEQPAVPAVNRTVLLVEDHEINRLLATAMLKRMGCTVISAENGAKALEILTQNSPEKPDFGLVLMDMQMPVMDGIESTRRIRQSGITAQQLPIIALTANAFSEDKAACAEAGMQDHVSKPIQFNDLHKAVCKWYFESPSETGPQDPVVAEEDPTIALLRPKYLEFRANMLDRLSAGIGSIDSWSTQQSGEILAMLHKLSGSAGAFGENDIAALATQFEEAIRQERSTDVLTSLAMQMLAYRRQDEDVQAVRA